MELFQEFGGRGFVKDEAAENSKSLFKK